MSKHHRTQDNGRGARASTPGWKFACVQARNPQALPQASRALAVSAINRAAGQRVVY